VGTLVLSGSANIAGTANTSSDTLVAGSGADTLYGSTGTDTFVINSPTDVVVASASATFNQVDASINDTIPANVNELAEIGSGLVGTANSSNVILLASTGDTLIAGAGSDTLQAIGNDLLLINNVSDVAVEKLGASSNDTLQSSVSYTAPAFFDILSLTGTAALVATANSDNDTLVSNTGADTLVGSSGNDTFVINNAADKIQDTSATAANTVQSAFSYTAPTNVNVLTLTGTGNLAATANSANDTLISNVGVDTLIGAAGNETFVVNNSADVITETSTTAANVLQSSVSYVLPTHVNSLVLTGYGNISGTGNAANDTLQANAGNDTLIAGSGVDTLIGGGGSDTFIINSASDVVVHAAPATNNIIQSSVSYSAPANVNTLMLTGTANLKATANSGNDTLVSNTGVDTLVGGTGNDTFVVNNALDVIQNASGSSSNTLQASVSYTAPTNANTIVLIGTGNIVGTANSGNDTLIAAGTGIVTLVGGAGNDTFVVNNVLDIVQDTSTTTTNAIQSSVNYTLPTHVNALTLIGSVALTATGNASNNVITANNSNDTLFAGSGLATLVGGSGNDTFVVNSVSDVVVDSASSTNNTIQSSVSFTLAANVNDLQLTGTAALTGTANSGSDTLVSNSGVDTLVGGSGPDLFIINNAADVILNAASNDTVESSVSYSLPANVTSLILVGSSNIQGIGNSSADLLTAGSGVDTLVAGTGIATMIGGAGNDTFAVNNANDVVVDSSTTTSNIIQSSVNYSLPANVDSLLSTVSTALTLTGNSDENNVLTASSGSDSVVGVAFNNTINGGVGIDTIDAGPGQNLIYSGNGGTSEFTPTIVNGGAPGTNVTTATTIYGGTGFDSLTGGPGTDLIYGGSGDDTVLGGAGVELLYAGSGGTVGIPTQVWSGSGFDTLMGGAGYNILADEGPIFGNDSIVAGSGADTLLGKGHDTLEAGNGTDLIEVESGIQITLQLNAGLTSVRVNQAGGNDNLVFGTGLSPTADSITASWDTLGGQTGQFGLDIIGSSGSVSIDGGLNLASALLNPGSINSVDFIDSGSLSLLQFIAAAHSAPATVTGGGLGVIFDPTNNAVINNGSNLYNIYGFGNNDTLTTNSVQGLVYAYGNDSDLFASTTSFSELDAEGSADTLNSSTALGTNFFINNGLDVVVQTVPDGGNDNVASSVSYTLPTNVTNLSLQGSANLIGTGNAGNSVIRGNAGNDTLIAGSGNATIDAGSGNQLLEGGSGTRNLLNGGSGADTLSAGSGATSMNGGTGINTFIVNSASDVLSVPLSAHDTVETSVTFDGNQGVQTIILTGSANIEAMSNAVNSTLVGGAGNDSLVFGAVEIGGSGTTYMEPVFSGPATMIGGSGPDYFNVFNAGDLIQGGKATDTVKASLANSGSIYTLPANIATLVLNNFSIMGVGNSLNDTLFAAADDTLAAGAGLATMIGGGGGDTYVINNGGDVIEGLATDTIQSSVSYTLPTAVNFLVLSGSGNLAGAATAGNNQIVGNSGDDTLMGGTGNDTLVAGAGIDTLIGGSGTDTFVINTASDVVQDSSASTSNAIQSSVSYSLAANFNSLTLTGTANLAGSASAGTDTLISNSGVDTLIGGAGSDTFVINNASDIIQDTSSIAANVAISVVSFTLPTDVNSLTLTGSAAIVGVANGGNDSLTGNAGANTLIGGSGVDTLTAGSAADTLVGGTGNTTFVVNSVSDVVQDTSMSAANVLRSSVSYVLPTNVNSLVLTGASALTGTANGGNDTLTSNTGLDTLVGGTGNDTFIVSHAGDVVQDSSAIANNIVQSSVAFTLPTDVNTLIFTGSTALHGTGSAGNDSMTANSGADTLSAGNGTDTLVSGTTGADSLVAGTGNDLFVVNSVSDVVSVGATHGNDTIQASVTYTASANVATLKLIGTSAITGTGNSLSDTITANSGADTLTAGAGVATLVGGAGNDTFVINSASDVIQDTSSTATNILSSSVSYTLPTNVNRLILTGTTALAGTANAGNDTLTANTGADTLTSGTGSAVDSLVGGTGADLFVVNNTSDIVTVGATHGVDTIQSSVSYTASVNVANLVLTGTAALAATGNSLAGTITANSGSDTLTAGTGADTLVGGTGNDLFVVNSASDVVSVGATHGVDTIQSSVTYTASANVANLTLTGTAALTGTGNSLANTIRANSGADTLTAGSGVATLVGGAGNDTFVVNSISDVVQDTSTTATNILSSSVSYTLATNVNRLILTGTAALVGTANSANDTLTANTGADTLVSGAGSAVDSLVAGTGADLFVVNNTSDIVTVGATHGVDTIQSSVSYTASTNVADLTLIGTAAIAGTGNSLAGTLTANNANDTLTAGSGVDTLVGGTGTDLFVVNSASDVVTLGTTGTSDTIQSSASYTLPTNVQYLTLTGTSALTGTGNSLTDLIVGNSGADTLVGGTGIAVLEGGRTAGSDQIKALSNQAALIGGAAASTLTGGAFKDFYAAGKVSDSITTGATANVVSVNKGDGATALQPTTSATNALSLGAGIDTESLSFTKTGNNLILSDGVAGDSITFTNWYVGAADQDYTTLQVVEIASANYNSGGTDGLRNKALEAFNFTALVAAYNTAGSPANWALSTAMPTTQLTSSSTADYGGDLAYYFGLNGNLTGMDLSAAQSTLTNASFGTATQTIDAFSGISGGGGLHLAVAPPLPQRPIIPIIPITPIRQPRFLEDGDSGSAISQERGIHLRSSAGSPSMNVNEPAQSFVSSVDSVVAPLSYATTVADSLQSAVNTESIEPTLRLPNEGALLEDFGMDSNSRLDTARVIANGNSPEVRVGLSPAVSTIQIPAISQATNAGASSADEDFLRAITPHISLPVRMGVAPATSSIEVPALSTALSLGSSTEDPADASDTSLQRTIAPGRFPELLDFISSASAPSRIASIQPTFATPRVASTITPVTISDIDSMLGNSEMRLVVDPQLGINWSQGLPKNLVDPINIAWLTMHDALDQSSPVMAGGSEASSDHNEGANDALLSAAPLSQIHRLPDELDIHSQQLRQRAV
jgi:trimeric autotransporter adhesin